MYRFHAGPFDAGLQESEVWLRSMMHYLGTENRQLAYLALRATLHALRDHFEPEETARLGARLPLLLRGVYYEAWQGDDCTGHDSRLHTFIARVREGIPGDSGIDPVLAARATAALLHERLGPTEPPRE